MVNTVAPTPGGIQIVQQIIGPNGEIQQIPIQLTNQQLQLIRAQMSGTHHREFLIVQFSNGKNPRDLSDLLKSELFVLFWGHFRSGIREYFQSGIQITFEFRSNNAKFEKFEDHNAPLPFKNQTSSVFRSPL